MIYTEEYFHTLNYSDYLSRQNRYLKLADELHDLFKKINLIHYNDFILDYGCAVGFLIKGFESLGYKNVYGYDISDWAISFANKFGLKTLKNINTSTYNLGIFLDVLEHMTDEQIQNVFNKVNFDKILVRIPCSIESNPTQFHLEVSRKDKSHINCKTKNQWTELLMKYNFKSKLDLNLYNIYDSDGCFCSIFLK